MKISKDEYFSFVALSNENAQHINLKLTFRSLFEADPYFVNLGITRVHLNILANIMTEGEDLTMSELAKATGFIPNNMSKKMQLLYKLNFVKRYVKDNDLRQVYIKMLPDGVKMMERFRDKQYELFLKQAQDVTREDFLKLIEAYKVENEILSKIKDLNDL